ncbi:MAG TPA: CoA transferase [Caldimonas sp.]|jgi:hypothetical protein|nr:CoA transferase [Caldimonas sp.]HEX2542066.1 CoA transferase [Caldimonas sp.]
MAFGTPGTAQAIVRQLWSAAGLREEALERLELPGSEPALPSSFPIGSALQVAIGAAGLAATELLRLRGGAEQAVSVDILDAVREGACRFSVDGRKPVLWEPLSGLYWCEGGSPGWLRVHANFAHHRDGVLRLLGLPPGPATTPEAVQDALRPWAALDFEQAAADRGLVVAAVRDPAQWERHPQAAAVRELPLIGIERIGAAPATPLRPAARRSRPLAGLRILELTRILAGPVTGRTLAAHGADVLLINGPHLPNIDAIAETSRGKLSAVLDLRENGDLQRMRERIREADVFLQAYRPGALAERGLGPRDLAELRPGIVYASLSAYGHEGPWACRRGFDSLVQCVTGLNVLEAQAFDEIRPRALCLQALDYGAGFLLAFGVLTALHRQWTEGGSWHVQVSLAGVAQWLSGLGRVPEPRAARWPDFDGVLEETQSGFGRLLAVPHAARLSLSPTTWQRPSMPPGSHAAVWPAR